jgi:hypothetical protein
MSALQTKARYKLWSAIELAGSANPSLDISAGNIPGQSNMNKFGGGFEAAAGTTYDVWDNAVANAVYDWPTTATITHVRAATDSAATQGLAVELKGLDANWNITVQNATLDAIDSETEVLLTTPLIRIFRKRVIANVVADQNIWSGATGMAAATATSVIQAGNNQTLMALYTVPNGKTAYMTGFYASVVDATNKTPTSTEVRLWAADRDNGYEFQLKMATAIAEGGSAEHHHFSPYNKFTQKTDIKVTMNCTDEAGHVHAGYDLILVDNA